MSLSVVIPNYNGRDLLQKNLPFVLDACVHWSPQEKQWEIIVVDDASKDDSVSWLQANYPQVRLIQSPRNLRFARAVNLGVAEASGDIVILLNSDVQPAKNFIAPLLRHFDDKQVFAVGCLENNDSGRGIGRFARGFLIHRRAPDQSQPTTLWVTAGSGAFRKSIWDKLGGLDPLFRPAYEEDRDLCYNALKSGYKLVFAPDSHVDHLHESTNKRVFSKAIITTMSFKNQFLFVWKNISSLKYFTGHLFWLPYHLLYTTIKSKGLFLFGLILAVNQLPEALTSRWRARKHWSLTDAEVLKNQ